MVTVAVGLGSNLGDRMGFLRLGIEGLIRGGLSVVRSSSVYESPPIGYLRQGPFLNLVLLARTPLDPLNLLSLLRAVEDDSGRERPFPNAPRTLDCDLVFYADRIVREQGLKVPHPAWKRRSFVVRPLLEIVPGFRDPETGWRVSEVALRWPMEPRTTELREGPEAFLSDQEQGT
jgi:2-amino-4-hydroxy-6-hydroxymethyldihydropteridine diphosphokinase